MKIDMPISQKLNKLSEPLDIDLQLLATEMDTSAKRIKFISGSMLEDALAINCFNCLIEDIERGDGVEITSFSDNAIMYEYLDEAIIVYTLLSEKYVLFDSMVTVKIESKMSSYIQR